MKQLIVGDVLKLRLSHVHSNLLGCLNKEVKRVKKCEYCRECIHYGKCSVYAPDKMECKDGLGCGCPVCCEDFVSRKTIDDINEEQKAEQPEYSDFCSSFCIICDKLFNGKCNMKDKSEFSDKPCPDFQELPF